MRIAAVLVRVASRPARRTISLRYYHEVSFQSTGTPEDVLTYHCDPDIDDSVQPQYLCADPSTAAGAFVRVQVHHAPWNPADVNTVEGRYPSPYDYSNTDLSDRKELCQSAYHPGYQVAGSEGWGRITDVVNNEDNSSLSVGDWVTFGLPGLGTMRSSLWLPTDAVVPIDRGQELFESQGAGAATLFQLGGTALRMLRDFVKWQHDNNGDEDIVILQNAGNSGVGLMLSQLASIVVSPNAKVASLVRRGNKSKQDFDNLVDHLIDTGNNRLVIAEEDLENREGMEAAKSKLQSISKQQPILALNAVGGASSSRLLQLLGPNGTHVTYGGMSKEPSVTVKPSQLIFKNLTVRGYWHSVWMIQHSTREKRDMMNELVDWVLEGQLVCPTVEVFPLSLVQQGLHRAATQSDLAIRRKIVFQCLEDIR